MERDVTEVCKEVFNYWKEIISVVESPEIDLDVLQSIYDCDLSKLSVAIKTSSPSELDNALNSEDEVIKMYYMQRIWYRYLDLKYNRTKLYDNFIQLTNDSSIHEIDMSAETLALLHREGVNYLFQLPEKMQNLPYGNALDAAAGLSLLKTRRAIC